MGRGVTVSGRLPALAPTGRLWSKEILEIHEDRYVLEINGEVFDVMPLVLAPRDRRYLAVRWRALPGDVPSEYELMLPALDAIPADAPDPRGKNAVYVARLAVMAKVLEQAAAFGPPPTRLRSWRVAAGGVVAVRGGSMAANAVVADRGYTNIASPEYLAGRTRSCWVWTDVTDVNGTVEGAGMWIGDAVIRPGAREHCPSCVVQPCLHTALAARTKGELITWVTERLRTDPAAGQVEQRDGVMLVRLPPVTLEVTHHPKKVRQAHTTVVVRWPGVLSDEVLAHWDFVFEKGRPVCDSTSHDERCEHSELMRTLMRDPRIGPWLKALI